MPLSNESDSELGDEFDKLHPALVMGMFFLFLLVIAYQAGIRKLPPVTLLAISGQAVIFLKLIPWIRETKLEDVCINAYLITYEHQFHRLATAAFFHVSNLHLYYNMASFLEKGIRLESIYGGGYFAYMLFVFAVMTNIVHVSLQVAAVEILEDVSLALGCSAGFSGVLFALKVLTTYNSQESERFFGMSVTGPYICWVELVFIQIFVPRTSFIGHLSGMLVGLLYLLGPLKQLMDVPCVPVKPAFVGMEEMRKRRLQRYT